MMEQKKKKVLTILGGPRRNGITAKMLACVESAGKNSGFEVNRINLYEKKISKFNRSNDASSFIFDCSLCGNSNR